MSAPEKPIDVQPASPNRGKGAHRDLVTRREKHLHLSCLERAVYQGWDIPESASVEAPKFLCEVMNDPMMDGRARIRAIEVLAALARDRVDAAVQLDRIMRLNEGSPTENVGVIEMSDATLRAVAESIRSHIVPAETPCRKPKRLPKA